MGSRERWKEGEVGPLQRKDSAERSGAKMGGAQKNSCQHRETKETLRRGVSGL